MNRFRFSIGVLLIGLLVLTAQSAAQMRGSSTITGQIVLCTGNGPVVVNTDRNGAPVGPTHVCPDCVLAFHADTASGMGLEQPVQLGRAVQWSNPVSFLAQARAPAGLARAPPMAGVATSI